MQPDVRIVLRFWKKSKRRNKNNTYKSPEDFSGRRSDYLPGIFGEVASYVYRENMVLTVFGILAGVGIGAFLHGKVIRTVEVDMMMFGRSIFFRSFLYSGLITLAFALLVNGMMYYRLKKIDMIESLKSVE